MTIGGNSPAVRWVGLALVSAGLGLGLAWIRLPAALLLGPALAAILFGVNGARLRLPRPAFIAAQATIGCLVARSLSPAILATLVDDGLVLLLVVSTTVLAGALVGWVLVRVGVLPGSTAAWGSSPGAASAMVMMAGEYGADVRLVGFMQYLRVILVVVTAAAVARLLGGGSVIPPVLDTAFAPLSLVETLAIGAVGAVAGVLLRVPAGALLGPMCLGAGLQAVGLVELVLPHWLLVIAYVAVGWTIGLGFTREVVVHALRALPRLLLSSLLLIGLCALSAWGLTEALGVDPLTAYLATSPGGLDSVAIIAVGSHADIPFVMAVQTLRVFVVILTGPVIARSIARHAVPRA